MYMAQLAKSLTDSVDSTDYQMQMIHVLNVGALLHTQGKWGKKMSYREIVKQYFSYAQGKCVEIYIVLTGMNRDHQ